MDKNLAQKITEKLAQLHISAALVGRILNIDKEKIYKWKKGHIPSDGDDRRKLDNFTNGLFDRFIKNGKIEKDYDYGDAIEIIFPRNPTNDFGGAKLENLTMAEDGVPMLPPYWESEFRSMSKELENLKKINALSSDMIKLLNDKLIEKENSKVNESQTQTKRRSA